MPLCCSKLLLQPAGICVVLARKILSYSSEYASGFRAAAFHLPTSSFPLKRRIIRTDSYIPSLVCPCDQINWDINDGVCDDVRVDGYV